MCTNIIVKATRLHYNSNKPIQYVGVHDLLLYGLTPKVQRGPILALAVLGMLL
jgi:hypothetical protein